ncbi:site-specific DNA-methyltransferase [Marinobacter orientalis]|uniref:site-specific DNA-methyltransferase (adenine-specific) n=1 Tax=Marinobacter orientalis TaxID=1928859 RepID=A0A7Y0NJT5_9GAMM|nr:site-specific DNA-methyltransferase [Marinobacter orientalis]NMT62786.1 site-specific DNA-methyltransferase [Marinobacter orientalis]TGX51465.1 site-specific DNA-methyltransferase [Marinobacter orientalis]
MDKLKMHSPDLGQDNIAKIQELFPGCVTEARDEVTGKPRLAVNFDQLKQELSDLLIEDGGQERYLLNWPGKREALIVSNAPIGKTLRPAEEESINFEATQNLFIESDNLDALKLLLEPYLGRVKLIYIDPPYNTGNDFVYDDRFVQGSHQYLEESLQRDSIGNRLLANTLANGRFHSDWLSMIYPRLRVAKNLLSEDGVIAISIDDEEVNNLRHLCDEVFGRENFVAQFVWKSRISEDTRAITGVSSDHEYIVCYARSDSARFRGSEKDFDKFSNADNDPRGPWRSADLTGLATKDARPNLHYDLIDPNSGINYGCPPKGWRYEPATMAKKIEEGRILFPSSIGGRPRHKLFLNEMKSLFKNISSVLGGFSTADGTRELNALMGGVAFTFPKPSALIQLFIEQLTEKDDIILDFFAGSGTTAQSVFKQCAADGMSRKFILAQVPEELDRPNSVQGAAAELCDKLGVARNIAELSKERIRRAGQKILEGDCHHDWNRDVGFRVLKVDTSNMKDIYYRPDELSQGDLLEAVDNVKSDRTPEDLLFQVLVDWGVDLTLPIRCETLQEKTVFFIDDNALVACFDSGVTEDLVKELAKHEPLRVVFRDNGFVSDAVKINVEQIFRQLSPSTEVRSL